MLNVIIANILNFIAGICSVLSVGGRTKKKIVRVEFLGSVIRIISNALVCNWSDSIGKVIKGFAQKMCLNNKLNKSNCLIISLIYLLLCLGVVYFSKDKRCLFAILPSILEFYALLVKSARKYRLSIIVVKILWTVNNIVFKLYVGIIFDIMIVFGHYLKVNKSKA